MPLLICPNCGRDVPDEHRYCQHCGFMQKIKNPQKPKLIKIFTWITIIVIILAVGSYLISTYSLSTDEKIAVGNVKDLKTMLKDPDSLKLYEDVLVIWYTDTKGDYNSYTYINYGAKNSYGAMGKSIAMYKGYTYIGDFDEVDEVNLSTDSGEDLEKKMQLIEVQLPYLAYQVEEISEIDITTVGVKSADWVNKNKVTKNIK